MKNKEAASLGIGGSYGSTEDKWKNLDIHDILPGGLLKYTIVQATAQALNRIPNGAAWIVMIFSLSGESC